MAAVNRGRGRNFHDQSPLVRGRAARRHRHDLSPRRPRRSASTASSRSATAMPTTTISSSWPAIPPTSTQRLHHRAAFRAGPTISIRWRDLLAVPVDNFAIGGALTDNSNTNGPPLRLHHRIDQLPRRRRAVAPSRRSAARSTPTTCSPCRSAATTRASTSRPAARSPAPRPRASPRPPPRPGSTALVAAGARNISFLAGDTAALARNRAPTRRAQAIRNAYSTAFNAGMQSTLAGYAANGAIVHYLDLNAGRSTTSSPIPPPMA